MSEIITNPYTGEVLSVVSETLEKFGITRQKLSNFLVSDFWSKTLNNYEDGIDHNCFNHCLEQWLENNEDAVLNGAFAPYVEEWDDGIRSKTNFSTGLLARVNELLD